MNRNGREFDESTPWNNIGKAISSIMRGGGVGNDSSGDDGSSDGASERSSNDGGATAATTPAALSGFASSGDLGAVSLIDNLSALFKMINNVCQEQFVIIRKVFPTHTVARTTRSLVQRVFNDPAFGIQHRVDEVLRPPPPLPPLPLPDYLDALLTIREKLSALYLLLLECSSHPSMRGMGSHSAAVRRAQLTSRRIRATSSASENVRGGGGGGGGSTGGQDGHMAAGGSDTAVSSTMMAAQQYEEAEEEAEDRMRSDAEIQDFFQDQVRIKMISFIYSLFIQFLFSN
jgi:hypothetical protein